MRNLSAARDILVPLAGIAFFVMFMLVVVVAFVSIGGHN